MGVSPLRMTWLPPAAPFLDYSPTLRNSGIVLGNGDESRRLYLIEGIRVPPSDPL